MPTPMMGDQQGSRRRRVIAVLVGIASLTVIAGTAASSNAASAKASASRAPTVRITSAPSNPTTKTSATFAFSTTGTTVKKTCQLDGKAAASCNSPKTYTGLTYGTHTFVVSATNSRGSARASYTSQVARPAPTVTLASPPSGSTTSTSITLAWTSTNATTIVCWLDSAAPVACAGPITFSNLALGTHKFTVKVSNESSSASVSATWTVAAAPTTTTPTTTTPTTTTPTTTTPTTTTPTTTTPTTTTPTTTTRTNPPPDSSAIQAPTPPSSYSIPTGAVTVTTSAALKTALNGSTRDIVLANGVYDNSSQFVNSGGHRLYAQNLGGAVLKAGIEMGGNDGSTGGLLQGIVFDVSDPAKVLYGGIVHIWGPKGAQSKVLDCVFRGNKALNFGLYVRNPSGLVAQRLEFYDFTDVALWASDDATVSYGAATPIIDSISDIYVNGVSRSVPGASDGTGEAGVWVGHPVTNGVHRIKTRNVGWSGIETVNNSWGTTFSDLDLDMSGPNESAGVGIYLEHFSYHNVFQRFTIRGANSGVTTEWNDPSWGGVAASHFSTFEDGTIDAAGANGKQTMGVWLDAGTDSTTIARVTFKNQNWAAICTYKVAGTNSMTGNDYSGLLAGAVNVTTGHPA
jgi:hypothetical protein